MEEHSVIVGTHPMDEIPMDILKINEIIQKNKALSFFRGHVPQAEIDAVEMNFALKLPVSYRWFLQEYGSGSFGSFEIIGLTEHGNNCHPSLLFWLNDFRRRGMPNNLIPIWDGGVDYKMVLDTSKFMQEEAPVCMFDDSSPANERAMVVEYPNFLEFLWNGITEELK